MGEQESRGVLKREIMLQINERLYIQKLISQEVYELAKVRIVSGGGNR